MPIYKDITETVGRTPLVEMKRIGAGLPGKLAYKLEFFNPLSSVKDRIGQAMIKGAETRGALRAGMEIVEPTSGNTGIALAFIAASRGYKLTLTMPETMSTERRTLLLMLGANIVLTPGPLGMKGAIAKAMEIVATRGQTAMMLSQFENPDNPAIHRETTAVEIWNDTNGAVDIVISGVGTGGTITGVGQALIAKKSSVQMIAVEPAESPVLSGGAPGPHKIQGIGAGFVPKILDMSLISGIEKVTSDEALAMAREVIRTEGLPVGISSGAAITAGLRVAAREENRGKLIVVIIPSETERYLSTLLGQADREKAAALAVDTVSDEWIKKVNQV